MSDIKINNTNTVFNAKPNNKNDEIQTRPVIKEVPKTKNSPVDKFPPMTANAEIIKKTVHEKKEKNDKGTNIETIRGYIKREKALAELVLKAIAVGQSVGEDKDLIASLEELHSTQIKTIEAVQNYWYEKSNVK